MSNDTLNRKDVEAILSELEENLRIKEDCQMFSDNYNIPLSKLEKYSEKTFDLVADFILNGFDLDKIEIPDDPKEAFVFGFFLARRFTDFISYLAFNMSMNQIFEQLEVQQEKPE